MQQLYVIAPAGKRWHWCRNCPDYPTQTSATLTVRPLVRLCQTCLDREERGTCKG